MKLSAKLQKELIIQMNREFEAFYNYLAMSSYFEQRSLKGIGAWMRGQSQEEHEHMMKYYTYIFDRDGHAEFSQVKKPKDKFKSAKEVFEIALKHEEHVTKTTHDLLELAQKEKDHPTINFLQWFVEEQVEEEAQIKDILNTLDMLGKDSRSLYFLDKELGKPRQ